MLVGVSHPAGLGYADHVGTRSSQAVLARLLAAVQPLTRSTSPFAADLPADAIWVEPVVVGEVGFAERTKGGRLRHPTWLGLRPDKDPSEGMRVK